MRTTKYGYSTKQKYNSILSLKTVLYTWQNGINLQVYDLVDKKITDILMLCHIMAIIIGSNNIRYSNSNQQLR